MGRCGSRVMQRQKKEEKTNTKTSKILSNSLELLNGKETLSMFTNAVLQTMNHWFSVHQ